jgi:hypothetical protein
LVTAPTDRRGKIGGMAKHRDPNAHATAYDVERVTATMAELSFDLERSVRAAVPIALA